MPSAPIVDRLRFDLDFASEADATDLHARIGHFAHRVATAVVARCLAARDPGDAVLRIDRLDVALGRLPPAEDDAAWAQRLHRAVEAALAQALGGPGPTSGDDGARARTGSGRGRPGAGSSGPGSAPPAGPGAPPRRLDAATAEREVVWYALCHGHLPWPASHLGPDGWDAVCRRVVARDAGWLRAAMGASRHRARLVDRVRHHWAADVAQALLEQASGDGSAKSAADAPFRPGRAAHRPIDDGPSGGDAGARPRTHAAGTARAAGGDGTGRPDGLGAHAPAPPRAARPTAGDAFAGSVTAPPPDGGGVAVRCERRAPTDGRPVVGDGAGARDGDGHRGTHGDTDRPRTPSARAGRSPRTPAGDRPASASRAIGVARGATSGPGRAGAAAALPHHPSLRHRGPDPSHPGPEPGPALPHAPAAGFTAQAGARVAAIRQARHPGTGATPSPRLDTHADGRLAPNVIGALAEAAAATSAIQVRRADASASTAATAVVSGGEPPTPQGAPGLRPASRPALHPPARPGTSEPAEPTEPTEPTAPGGGPPSLAARLRLRHAVHRLQGHRSVVHRPHRVVPPRVHRGAAGGPGDAGAAGRAVLTPAPSADPAPVAGTGPAARAFGPADVGDATVSHGASSIGASVTGPTGTAASAPGPRRSASATQRPATAFATGGTSGVGGSAGDPPEAEDRSDAAGGRPALGVSVNGGAPGATGPAGDDGTSGRPVRERPRHPAAMASSPTPPADRPRARAPGTMPPLPVGAGATAPAALPSAGDPTVGPAGEPLPRRVSGQPMPPAAPGDVRRRVRVAADGRGRTGTRAGVAAPVVADTRPGPTTGAGRRHRPGDEARRDGISEAGPGDDALLDPTGPRTGPAARPATGGDGDDDRHRGDGDGDGDGAIVGPPDERRRGMRPVDRARQSARSVAIDARLARQAAGQPQALPPRPPLEAPGWTRGHRAAPHDGRRAVLAAVARARPARPVAPAAASGRHGTPRPGSAHATSAGIADPSAGPTPSVTPSASSEATTPRPVSPSPPPPPPLPLPPPRTSAPSAPSAPPARPSPRPPTLATPSARDATSPGQPRPASRPEPPADAEVTVRDAGLVLTAGLLPTLFGRLQWLHGRDFRDDDARARAVQALHVAATGRPTAFEPALLLPKLLCGWDLDRPMPGRVDPGDEARALVERMLEALIRQWGVLGATTPDGLREGFIRREGLLARADDGGSLTVQSRALDVLLDRWPWPLGTLRTPWMREVLHVHWR